MIAAVRSRSSRLYDAMRTSSRIARWFYEVHRKKEKFYSPEEVLRLLNSHSIRFILAGTHGVGAWRSEPRASHDVDVLVASRDYGKAIRLFSVTYPNLVVDAQDIFTRFVEPRSGGGVIDVMRPNAFSKAAFVNFVWVNDKYRVPDLEMSLAWKFAVMKSKERGQAKQLLDASDFMNIFEGNKAELDRRKLQRLGALAFRGGGKGIAKLVDDIEMNRKIWPW